jgi:hypothetical protein
MGRSLARLKTVVDIGCSGRSKQRGGEEVRTGWMNGSRLGGGKGRREEEWDTEALHGGQVGEAEVLWLQWTVGRR